MRLVAIFSVLFLAGVEAIAPIVSVDDAVADSFLVVLKDSISSAALKSHRSKTSEILSSAGAIKKSEFDVGGLKGYHVQASRSVVEQIAESDEARYSTLHSPRISDQLMISRSHTSNQTKSSDSQNSPQPPLGMPHVQSKPTPPGA
jgi:hypothetical protein